MSESLAKLVEDFLENHCNENKYNIKKSQQSDYLRIDVSNRVENINVNLYKTGKLAVGGSPKSKLYQEFKGLKEKIEKEPELLTGTPIIKAKACATRYDILLPIHRDQIKNLISQIEGTTSNIINLATPSESYRAKISATNSAVSMTQYVNGTILIQGKEGNLFDEVCELIEKTATPTEQEVIARFLSNDEAKLEEFTLAYTPKLLEQAEKNMIAKLGDAYHFLESYDKKYLIASECLQLSNLPLPEYSAYVMPAAKGFEGFTKKLLTKLNYYAPGHFASKTATISHLTDKTYVERLRLIGLEKYAGSFLDMLSNCFDMTRNFMMHSDGSTVTKVNNSHEASMKLNDITDNIKQIFDYFNKAEFGGIYP